MFKDELKKYVAESSLVNMKSAGEGIYVLKYKKKVFYDGLWNDYLTECRGSIVDADFNLVTYPFTKIYNYGIEKDAPVFSDDTVVTAYRKVNGFMVAVTRHNGDVLVSTTGSTDSDFVGMAKEMMLNHMSWDNWQRVMASEDLEGMTIMFECVHPNDPHIVPEEAGMYILGYRYNIWRSPVGCHAGILKSFGKRFNCFVPDSYRVTMAELMQMVKECRHEGFVFYADDGRSSKIKSKYYLVQKALARKKDILSLNKELLDEEFYPMVDHLSSIRDEFNSLDEQARLEYMRNYLETA
jgi:hypothetical protein